MGENPPPSVIVGTLLAIVRPQLTELTFVIRKYMNYLHRMHFKPISIFYQDGGPMLDPIPSMRGSGNHVEVSRDKKISCFSWLSLNCQFLFPQREEGWKWENGILSTWVRHRGLSAQGIQVWLQLFHFHPGRQLTELLDGRHGAELQKPSELHTVASSKSLAHSSIGLKGFVFNMIKMRLWLSTFSH